MPRMHKASGPVHWGVFAIPSLSGSLQLPVESTDETPLSPQKWKHVLAPMSQWHQSTLHTSVNQSFIFLWASWSRWLDPHSPIDLIFPGLYLARGRALLVLVIVVIASSLCIHPGGPFEGNRHVILPFFIPRNSPMGNWSYIHPWWISFVSSFFF